MSAVASRALPENGMVLFTPLPALWAQIGNVFSLSVQTGCLLSSNAVKWPHGFCNHGKVLSVPGKKYLDQISAEGGQLTGECLISRVGQGAGR